MTKTELVSVIAEKAGTTKKDAETALKAVLDSITDALADGKKVQLVGFGTFEVHERAERDGVNPRTKEKIKIAAANVARFKPGRALKEAVQ
ncbi:MAG: HU family DNA-binding protein [Oscillospiraceae bacterium]|nr:HU family DNA-binding protein [Oscillospiraceae bacterium]